MPTQTIEQAIALMSDVVARAKKQEEPLSGQRTYTGSNYISAHKAEIFYADAQKLMRDIVNVYDAITQNWDAPLSLESEKNTYTVAQLIEKKKLNAFNNKPFLKFSAPSAN